ncbi:MAG: hypothetical protein D6717_12535 [Gammaproteobacteria bacterium]|nr:MAG: hypothetical protein D6717_12535 [Gammaproteobacteria bacterium]
MSKVVAHIDGASQIEYDRSKPLPEQQQAYLDKMDADMDRGIVLGGVQVAQPDLQQKAQFIAQALAEAIRDDNEPVAAATLSWLANRLPDLKQVKIKDMGDGRMGYELIFDREFAPENRVQFFKPEDLERQ